MAFLSSRTVITILTLITAVIHLALGAPFNDTFGYLFLLNGIGYLVLLYATFWTPGFLKSQKSLIRWVFIGFTVLTIVLYFIFNGADAFTSVPGLATKLVEVLLLLGLWQTKA